MTVADQTAGKIVNYDVSSDTQSETPIPAGTVPGPIAYNHYGFLHVFDRSSGNVVEVFGPGEELTLHAGSPGGPVPGGIAALGQGGDSGAFFVTGAPTQGLWENVDERDPPKIRSPYLDVGDSKIDVPFRSTTRTTSMSPSPTKSPNRAATKCPASPFKLQPIDPAGLWRDHQPGRRRQRIHDVVRTARSRPRAIDPRGGDQPGVSYLSLLGTQAVEPSVGPEPRNTDQRFLAGAANASSELAVGGGYFLDVDDDSPALRLYKDDTTGFPLRSWEASGLTADTDFEAIARSGNKVFQADSFAEGVGSSPLVEYTIRGEGSETELSTKDIYYGLEQELIAWDNSRGALRAGSVLEEDQKSAEGNGLALEGLEFALTAPPPTSASACRCSRSAAPANGPNR